MVKTFKEYFFGAHSMSAFLVMVYLVLTLIYKVWIFLIIGLVLFPSLYLFLYHCHKKRELEYEEQTRKNKQRGTKE
ncbi:hypothetical protein LCGC14_0569930 [marine sediment metagenome]|uniref:Uncharacterized protein n=1 Tax=marine sediment metagenome TaxID=412755 RepID=A0A0F9U5U6_9ZZZZ